MSGGGRPAAARGHVSPGAERSSRLLLITYHFPPGQSVGALRWQQFARHAHERGWALDVITLHPAELDSPDWTALDHLPQGTRVWGVHQPSSVVDRIEQGVLRLRRVVRDLASTSSDKEASPGPDGDRSSGAKEIVRADQVDWWPRSGRDVIRAYNAWRDFARDGAWSRAASELGLQVSEQYRHDAVVTCGPPHMAHEAGRRLARKRHIPWVMDMRDAWSFVTYLYEDRASPLWPALARYHERRCVRYADLIVANTEPARAALARAHSDAADRTITVMNGFDEDAPVDPPPADGPFRVAFAGTLYLDRNPAVLFEAVSILAREAGVNPDQMRLELMGHVETYRGRPVDDIAREHGVSEFVSLHAARPRDEALQFLSDAQVLVSLPQEMGLAIPSKVFEYMQFHAWMVVVTRSESATGELLESTPADVVPPDNPKRLAQVFRERYVQFRKGDQPRPLATTHEEYSRRVQAERLFDAMDSWRGTESGEAATKESGSRIQTPTAE